MRFYYSIKKEVTNDIASTPTNQSTQKYWHQTKSSIPSSSNNSINILIDNGNLLFLNQPPKLEQRNNHVQFATYKIRCP